MPEDYPIPFITPCPDYIEYDRKAWDEICGKISNAKVRIICGTPAGATNKFYELVKQSQENQMQIENSWFRTVNDVLLDSNNPRRTATEVEMLNKLAKPAISESQRLLSAQVEGLHSWLIWKMERHFRFNPSLEEIFSHVGRAILLAFWK